MDIKHIDGYDCIDDNLEIILRKKGLDLRRIFNNLWYFEYDKNSNTIGTGLMNTNDNKYKSIHEKLNIDYKIYRNNVINKEICLKNLGEEENINIIQINQIIKNELKKENIIIVEMDTFKYEYDKGYKKYRGTHSCVLNKIEENNAFIIDVWYKLYNQKIKYEKLLNSITRIIVLDISESHEKSIDTEEFMESIIDEKSITEMRDFFKELENINLKKEYLMLNSEMLFKAPIDKGLRKIIMNRQRYAYYLKYLGENKNNKQLLDFAQYIIIISMEWVKLRNYLMQIYLLNKTVDVVKLRKICESIVEKEQEIKEEIGEVKW